MNLQQEGRIYILKLFEKMSMMQIVLIAVSVIVLIMLSLKDVFYTGSQNEIKEENKTMEINNDEYVKELEGRLKTVLATVDGVGKVDVMITLKASAEKVALKDIPVSSDITNEEKAGGDKKQQTNSKSEESTIYEENGKDKVPYVVKEIEPQIMGVVVVSQGGDNPTVKKEIIEAVQVLFGIETHMIKVMKQL